MEKLCGIYKITCLPTNQCYIGQSVGIKRRFRHHISDLKNNRHNNRYMQNVFNKYGANNFAFEIIELCSIEKLDEREMFWIAHYGGVESKANFNFESGGHKNKFYNNDFKKARSEKYKGAGIPCGEKTRFKKGLPPWNKGKKTPLEIREKLKQAHLGFKVSDETKKKLSIVNKGKRLGKERYNAKCVFAYDKAGQLVKKFDAISEAKKFLGIKGNYLIRVSNKNKLYRGYYWKVEEKDL